VAFGSGDGVTIRIDGLRAVDRDLSRTNVKLSDLDFRGIANEGMRLAASFAPARSGRLKRSFRASKSKNKATIRAGLKSVPYAGVINYGWPRRNIKRQGFMQKADRILRRRVPRQLEKQVRRIIRQRRLGL
jgi:hypothetical protein